jgi:hypothetical protein
MDLKDYQFHAYFGLSKTTIIIFFSFFQFVATNVGFILNYVLWTFYFLKVYNTIDISTIQWKVDSKTYCL